jgi:dsRNA-specific ribonuclease
MAVMMENFRDFTAGPDPFGRTWHILFKYLQTGISIRHSDSVDVRFVLDNGEEQIQKTVVIPHAEIRAFGQSSGRTISDTWCSRLAACHLRRVIETAEDFEKDYITVTPKEIEEYDSAIKKWEAEWVKKHAA